MEAVIYYARTDGIELERMIRKGHFNMHGKHFHNQYEIFYLLEGERRFFFDNRSYLVKGGSLILVDENSIHMTTANSEQEIGHDRIILYVERDKMKEFDRLFPNLNLVKFFHQHYGVFPLKIANKVIEEGRYVHQVFGGFIIGKLLDSLIIGLICFVLLGFANMPYVLLVSVIVGVTNVIPFFGPFIGAIPSAFLILLSDPMKCLYFLIFVLLLQQFDGNILGPKILGDSTGLSSFWVLFSILLFGGLMGFVGMIIGVPTFAVMYRLVTEFTTWRLGKKALSGNLNEYDRLNYIDETEQTYIKK